MNTLEKRKVLRKVGKEKVKKDKKQKENPMIKNKNKQVIANLAYIFQPNKIPIQHNGQEIWGIRLCGKSIKWLNIQDLSIKSLQKLEMQRERKNTSKTLVKRRKSLEKLHLTLYAELKYLTI